MRYGLMTQVLMASTAATAIVIVTAQSTTVSHGGGIDDVMRSRGPLTTESEPCSAPAASSR